MPIRIPVKGVHVHRDGKLVVPPLNKPFEFTAAEVEDLARMAPDHVRHPIVEEDGEVVAAPARKRPSRAKAAAKPKADGGDKAEGVGGEAGAAGENGDL